MEDLKRHNCTHKVNGHMHKARKLTRFSCVGSSEEGVMEGLKGDKCTHEVNGHMHKSKRTHSLLLCR